MSSNTLKVSSVRIVRSLCRRSVASTSHSVIDCHTHMYTPKYMDILRKRSTIPRVVNVNNEDRLIILPGEDAEITTSSGRPIGREYFDVDYKLRYMDKHCISTSLVSLANPWLDFLSGKEAESVAQELNDELEDICAKSKGRIFGIATLPVRNTAAAVKEVQRIKSLKHMKGIILGTPGAGNGLDHDNMKDVLGAIEASGFPIFLHPHYGVGNEHYHDSGHALFLALGFPFETTVSVSRLIVSGTFDKLPNLKIMVAHAGAALPSLIGRLDSCVAHDLAVANRLQHEPSTYFKKLYFDAISYGSVQLQGLIDQVGVDRIVFGTDNPFFPPPNLQPGVAVCDQSWPSTVKVIDTISSLKSSTEKQKILAANATKLFSL